MAMARSQCKVLLADTTKFGVLSLCTYCRMEDFDALVTDREPPVGRLQKGGENLIVCPPVLSGSATRQTS
jgi:DeoR/GlpR family transcriptional regulator of sugar metabolism